MKTTLFFIGVETLLNIVIFIDSENWKKKYLGKYMYIFYGYNRPYHPFTLLDRVKHTSFDIISTLLNGLIQLQRIKWKS